MTPAERDALEALAARWDNESPGYDYAEGVHARELRALLARSEPPTPESARESEPPAGFSVTRPYGDSWVVKLKQPVYHTYEEAVAAAHALSLATPPAITEAVRAEVVEHLNEAMEGMATVRVYDCIRRALALLERSA